MPTGYTAKLNEGDQSFEDFVMGCARAFGALIMMRDEPRDAEIPERFEPSDYHVKAEAEARDTIRELESMTDDQIRAYDAERARETEERNNERRRETDARHDRYEAMLERVHEWEPPTPDHEDMKRFMIEQIEKSIDFDCAQYDLDPPTHAGRLAEAYRGIAYHKEEYRKEVERTEERNRWLKALRESLREEVSA